MSESTFEAELQAMLDRDEPSNTIIEAGRGIGTLAILRRRLAAAGANVLFVDGRLPSALSLLLPNGDYAVEQGLLAADTLVVHEAASMHTDLAGLIEGIAHERAIHGNILGELKRVILIYPDWGHDGRRFFLDLGTNYVPLRITRPAAGTSVVEAELEDLRARQVPRAPASEYRSALTLKPGDVLTIPGVGTRLIGAVDQIDFDRYRIRLDEKFVESVVVDVRTNGDQRTPEKHVSRRRGADRIHSRNPVHFRQDLAASLEFALGDDYEAHAAVVREILDLPPEYRGNKEALVAVKTRLGIPAFGKALLYHLENKTSLHSDAEALTSTRSLELLGMTAADLGWPDEVLNALYRAGE